MSKKRIICICGPTGAGKTGSSIAAAARVGGAIVNYDSRQVYSDFPIITAQPSSSEQSACPHRLYGFLETSKQLTAPAWAEMAASEMDLIIGEGRTPILVGGTGFYLQALLEPLSPIPEVSSEVRESVQERCKKLGSPALHLELEKTDPESAARIHPNDTQRVTRAVEVLESTGRTLSEWQKESAEPPDYEPLYLGIGLDIRELESMLDARIGAMIEAGALEEARKAWDRCPDRNAPGWSGIGCAELLSYLMGDLSLDEARALWFRNTRAYAKRQLTWFKRNRRIRWFRPGDANSLADAAEEFMAGKVS